MTNVRKTGLLVTSLIFLTFDASAEGCSSGEPYPPSLIKHFMGSCAAKPELRGFCECTIDKLQHKLSLYDYVELENTSTLHEDRRFKESTNECLEKITPPVAAQ